MTTENDGGKPGMSQLQFLNRILMRHDPGRPLETVHPRPASRFESESPQPGEQPSTPRFQEEPHQPAEQHSPAPPGENSLNSSNTPSEIVPHDSHDSHGSHDLSLPAHTEVKPPVPPGTETPHEATRSIPPPESSQQQPAPRSPVEIHFNENREQIPLESSRGILSTPELAGIPNPATPKPSMEASPEISSKNSSSKTTSRNPQNVPDKVSAAKLSAAKVTADKEIEPDSNLTSPLAAEPSGESQSQSQSRSQSHEEFFNTVLNPAPGQTGILLEETLPAGLRMPVPSSPSSESARHSFSSQRATNTQPRPEPVVNVTIGRVEVRASAPKSGETPGRPKKPSGIISLDKYLSLRSQSPEHGGQP